MTTLFRRVDPAKKFRITKGEIARILGVAESIIVKFECWPFVLFVHRKDIGGQFVSYRVLEHWKNAIASQFQQCSTLQQLNHLWSTLKNDRKKHRKQYEDSVLSFLQKIWQECQDNLSEPLVYIQNDFTHH
ncbi:hypothetical protein [Microseira wollei]|uniref:Uncharacterized protein n=1 Tax=Microseira wollei NIES-4236 TaxID=2530354 RepID=A0AAV3X841_9CYAN|nr:hypothetical protein [Microseira wollei]GET39017.1 hypothetical protein MiSe_37770 [Microseira wollei NIES-4236]